MSKTLTLNDLIAPNFDDLLFDILDHKHTHYIIKGGRGSTKSSFVSIAIILLLTRPENKDMNAIIFRKTGNTLRDSVYSQMQFAISTLGLQDYFTCTISPMKIIYKPTKQEIMFRGVDDKMKIKSIKAPSGYFAITWLEEADTFQGMEEIRNVLQSTMRGGSKYWVFMSYNPPRTRANFMNQESLIAREDRLVHSSDYRSVPVEWLGEQFISEAEFLKDTNYNAYEHEYLGVANGNGGNVFENIEVREITDEEIKNFDRIYHGVDWGYYPDIYAFTTCHYDSARQTLYIYEEYTSNKESNETTANVLINQFNVGADLITCDSAEPKSVADYRAFGLNARETEKGAGSVEYSMKWLARLKIVIDPIRCPIATKEFSNYEYERDKEGNVISGYPDKDNHCIDSIRYALNPIWRRRGQ